MDVLANLAQSALFFSYAILPNWGGAILLFTFALRITIFPLQTVATREQAKLARLKPALDSLQEKYRSDARRFLVERSLVLKNAGVRPWISVVAALVQVPIFFAVFKAISTNTALADVGFAWLPNLAQYDHILWLA